MSSSPPASTRAKRTSVKRVSYAIPKPYITDSSDSSDSDSNNNDNNNKEKSQQNGIENDEKTKKKKRKPSPTLSDPIETDVSEYDAEEEEDKKNRIRKLRGKGKADESSEEDEEEGEPTSSSGPDEEDDDDDDIADDDLESDPGSPDGGRKRNNNKTTTSGGGNSRSGRSGLATSKTVALSKPLKVAPRLINVAPAVTSTNNSADLNSKRASNIPPPKDLAKRAANGVGYYDKFSLPFFPPVRKLKENSENFVGSEIDEVKKILDDSSSHKLFNDWCEFPFGPDRLRVQDIGWWKGKWNEEERTVNEKWGGWYSELKPATVVRIKEANVSPYMPRNCHPSKPLPLTTIDKPAEKNEEGDAEANQMEIEEELPAASASDPAAPINVWVGDASDQDSEQRLLGFERFDTHRLDSILDTKPGSVLNAGGPVSGLAWCPGVNNTEGSISDFLAISTLSTSLHLYNAPQTSTSMIQIWSIDTSIPSDLSPTTHETDKGSGMKLELGICIDIGEALNLKWCPKGGKAAVDKKDSASLGVLAGAFTDGSISLFLIPDPSVVRKSQKVGINDVLYIKSSPILKLSVDSTSCSCFSWGTHETIIAGCMDGSVIDWNVGNALRSGAKTARPTHFFRAQFAAIRDISFILAPPHSENLDGTLDVDGEPTRFVLGAYDGATAIFDIRDYTNKVVFSQDRGIGAVAAYDAWTGTIHTNDPECRTRAFFVQPSAMGQNRKMVICQGPVLSIGLSTNHPYAATTSTDGSVLLGNSIRPLRKKSHTANYHQKLYRFDFNRKTGEYRMIDNFLPETRKPVDAPPKNAKKKPEPPIDEELTSGAWPVCLSVLSSDWHPDLNRACLLATGLACGLVRIDWVEREVDFDDSSSKEAKNTEGSDVEMGSP